MEKNRTSDGFIISDAITDMEGRLPFKELLVLEYFTKYRAGYYELRELGVQISDRNYYNLLKFLTEIYEYRVDDAKAIAKKLRTAGSEWRNYEAIFGRNHRLSLLPTTCVRGNHPFGAPLAWGMRCRR